MIKGSAPVVLLLVFVLCAAVAGQSALGPIERIEPAGLRCEAQPQTRQVDGGKAPGPFEGASAGAGVEMFVKMVRVETGEVLSASMMEIDGRLLK